MKNYGRKLGECVCKNCGKVFEKPQSEITRNEKLNRPNFCSRHCVGVNNAKYVKDLKSNNDISLYSSNRRDEYTYFRYHYRNIKNRERSKGVEVSINLEDLKDQWEIQNGRCEFTGVILEISEFKKINTNHIYSASLDRIDSSKGYIKGNIRWVSRAINHMKNDMTDDMVWELCRLISENYKQKQIVN